MIGGNVLLRPSGQSQRKGNDLTEQIVRSGQSRYAERNFALICCPRAVSNRTKGSRKYSGFFRPKKDPL